MAFYYQPKCSICKKNYDVENVIPRINSCGHTFCEPCLLESDWKCPSCFVNLDSTTCKRCLRTLNSNYCCWCGVKFFSVSHLPINNALLQFEFFCNNTININNVTDKTLSNITNITNYKIKIFEEISQLKEIISRKTNVVDENDAIIAQALKFDVAIIKDLMKKLTEQYSDLNKNELLLVYNDEDLDVSTEVNKIEDDLSKRFNKSKVSFFKLINIPIFNNYINL